MKFIVIKDFGFAAKGDSMLKASVSGDAHYIEGFLRTKRRYIAFVIPAMHVGAAEDETPEEVEYHARYSDPETSHEQLSRLGSAPTEREQAILDALKKRGATGATSREACELTGIPHVSTSTIMAKMVSKQMLADTDVRRSRAIVRIAIQTEPGQGMLL